MPAREVELIRERRVAAARRRHDDAVASAAKEQDHQDDDLPDPPSPQDAPSPLEAEASLMRRAHIDAAFRPPVSDAAGTRADATLPPAPVPAQVAPPALPLKWSAAAADDAESAEEGLFCVRYSPDDALVAAGVADGSIRVFNSANGKLVYTLVDGVSRTPLPITCLRFRPEADANSSRMRHVLLAAGSDGAVRHWHVTSRKCIHVITEEDNQVNAVDFSASGDAFATAGRDCTVRLYDESTRTCVAALCGTPTSGVDRMSGGHSNRIFALKWREDDPHSLLSAGWDNTVQIWDTRARSAVASIYGPHVCGDALDVCGHTLLTGSWRPEHQLQEWDLRTCKLASETSWGNAATAEGCRLYAAQFTRHDGGAHIVAGGSATNELKVFSRATHTPTASVVLPRGLYGLCVSSSGDSVATAVGDTELRVFSLSV